MRNAGGYSVIVSPGERTVERDTYTCVHCGQITFTESPGGKLQVLVMRADGSQYLRDVGFCRNCYAHICPRCEGKPCKNRFAAMDEEEAVSRRFHAEWI